MNSYSTMRTFWYLLPVALLSIASTPQPGSSSLVILYRGHGVYSDSSLVHATLGEGRKVRHIEGRTFRSGEDPTPHLGPIQVATHGELPILVNLVDSVGDTLASVRATLRLQPHFDFWITIVAGRVPRPKGMCIDDVHAAPLGDSSPTGIQDSMFVVVGGLPAGAVC